MLRSIVRHLRRDNIRQRDLLENKSWDLDGKNFRALLQEIGHADWSYPYGFGNGSHFVHGDWRDLTLFHLVRNGRRYQPNREYATTDPRITCATTTVCLRVLLPFVGWNKSDPDNFVRPIIRDLAAVNEAFDAAHEAYLQDAVADQ